MRASPFSRLLVGTIVVGAGVAPLAHAQRADELAKVAVHVVQPEYPYEARRSRITGHGVLVADVDYATGKVASVKIEKSTGSRILDQAALSAFSQWQFKPRTIRQFRTPIHYEMADSRAEAIERIRREPPPRYERLP
jgi:TonB family protein